MQLCITYSLTRHQQRFTRPSGHALLSVHHTVVVLSFFRALIPKAFSAITLLLPERSPHLRTLGSWYRYHLRTTTVFCMVKDQNTNLVEM